MPKRDYFGHITNHETLLNANASHALNGISDDDPVKELVDLLRSSDPIDPITRASLASALERTSGLRLALKRDAGTPKSLHSRLRVITRYQEMAREVNNLLTSGEVALEKQAISIVAERNDVTTRTVEAGLRHWRRRAFDISPYRSEP